MGLSEKDKAASDLNNTLKGYSGQVKNTNTQVKNRYDSLEMPFDYKKTSQEIAKLTDSALNKINRTADEDINVGQADTAASLASQGITGGSMLNNSVGKVRTGVNKNRFNSITDTLDTKSKMNMDAMGNENQFALAKTAGASQIDIQNIAAELQRLGILGNSYGQQGANIGNLDDDIWFDSILEIANTASGFVSPLSKLLKGGAATGGGGGKV